MYYNKTDSSVIENDVFVPSKDLLVLAGCAIVPMILLALVGNILTIISFVKDSTLRTPINIYILNLAIADLFIAVISMPFYLTYTLNRNVWPFGDVFCKLWLIMDYLATTVSVFFMIVISYDRLLLLKNWTVYLSTQTLKRASVKCICTWVFALLLNGPSIIAWDIWTGVDVVKRKDCDAQFSKNAIYIGVIALLGFITPVVILIVVNVLVVRRVRKLKKEMQNLTQISDSSYRRSTSDVFTVRDTLSSENHQQNGSLSSKSSAVDSTAIELHIPDPTSSSKCLKQNHTKKSQSFNSNDHRKSHSIKTHKAANTLAVLVLAFLITWAPYMSLTLTISVCDDCISIPVYETFIWLLWFKSSLNPFLYAWRSRKFRKNFKRLLCCDNMF